MTMRAMELGGFHEPLRLVQRPVPIPGPGEVRVRIEACGVCGSDLFLQRGGFGRPLPIVPGHEAAGRVDALGDGVSAFEPGQQVALAYIVNRGGTPSARPTTPSRASAMFSRARSCWYSASAVSARTPCRSRGISGRR